MGLESLYRAHFALVWRALRRFGVSEKDAQDAAQEVFLIAARRLSEFESRSSVKTWLLGIAYRVAANRRRSAVARFEVLDAAALESEPSQSDAQGKLEERELLRLLDEALDRLPLEQRAVFTMFELEGLTGQEIALALELPLGTVRSRLRLAREAFLEIVAPLRAGARSDVASGGGG